MLLQDKKGLSIMIGYVLLVAIAIIMSMIVYQFIVTYVPRDVVECSDGLSVFIKETKYDCVNEELEVTIKNNGRFNVAGYFIHATTAADQELATEDLSGQIISGGEVYRNSVIFVLGDNSLSPNEEKKTTFDLSGLSTIYGIEIIPVIWQEDDAGKERFTSCSDGKVEEALSCWTGLCVDGATQDCPLQAGVCLGSERTCVGEEWPVCDYSLYAPVPPNNYEVTEITCDGVADNDCDGDTDEDDSDCAPLGSPSCDGVWEGAGEDMGVECDGTPTPENCVDCVCDSGYIPDGSGGCELPVTTIAYFGFESGAQAWIDGGSDSDRSSARSKVQDDGTDGGQYSWHIQDNSYSSYTKQNFDFTGYTQVIVEWWGYYEDLENNECIEFKIDGTKVTSWGNDPDNSHCDNDITQDTWLSQSITLLDTSYTFDSSVEIRFEGEMSGDYDEFYLDGIKINGLT